MGRFCSGVPLVHLRSSSQPVGWNLVDLGTRLIMTVSLSKVDALLDYVLTDWCHILICTVRYG